MPVGSARNFAFAGLLNRAIKPEPSFAGLQVKNNQTARAAVRNKSDILLGIHPDIRERTVALKEFRRNPKGLEHHTVRDIDADETRRALVNRSSRKLSGVQNPESVSVINENIGNVDERLVYVTGKE